MTVEIIYRYIYLPAVRSAAPSGGAGANILASALRHLSELESAMRDQAQRELLEDLKRALNRVAAIAAQIKSPGIQRMLQNAADDIVKLAAEGNPEGALAAAQKLITTAETAQEQVYHIKANIAALKNPTSVQGKAAALCKKIADAADAALNAASSMDQLADLTQVTDKARGLMEQVKGMSPTHRDYAAVVAELGGILDTLDTQQREQPAMAQDAMTWSREEGRRVADAIQQLRDGTRDAFTLEKLDQLDLAMVEVMRAAQGLDPASAGTLRTQLDGLLKQAATGQVQGAIEGATRLAETLAQVGRLRTTMEGRLGHLAAAGQGLEGQPKERVDRVLTGLREALGRAQSPEEMLRLDGLLQEALEAASTLRAAGKGAGVRHPAYLKLLQTERGLGAYLPAAPAGPRMEGDTLVGGNPLARPGSDRLPPRIGTRPLTPPGTAQLPPEARLEQLLASATGVSKADAQRVRDAVSGSNPDTTGLSKELLELIAQALSANPQPVKSGPAGERIIQAVQLKPQG